MVQSIKNKRATVHKIGKYNEKKNLNKHKIKMKNETEK